MPSYPIINWRGAFDIAFNWLIVLGAVLLCVKISWWFYPLSVLVIANRLLAISLIGHEALHGNLFTHSTANDFFGRWLCCFPALVSLSKYRRFHIRHHSGVGNHLWDPDLELYNFYPISLKKFLKRLAWETLTLNTALKFTKYYSEVFEFLTFKRNLKGHLLVFSKGSDFFSFLFFLSILTFSIFYFHWEIEFTLLYLLPVLVLVQPYVLLMGGLQHGPLPIKGDTHPKTRTVTGPGWLMALVLPLDINYHQEHHKYPHIPHYWLAKFHTEFSKNNRVRSQSYLASLRSLFYTET